MPSKTTIYVEGYDSDGPQIEADLHHAGAECVKIEWAFGRALIALANGMTVFYRDMNRFEKPFDGKYGVGDPEALAFDWFEIAVQLIELVPADHRDQLFLNGAFNEVGQLEDPETLFWYNRFELARMKLLEEVGVRAAIFAFSAEARIYDKWKPLEPAIRHAAANGHVFDTHGYNSPTLFDGGPSGNDVEFLFNYIPLAKELEAAGIIIPDGFFWIGEKGIDSIISSGKSYPGWLTTGCTARELVDQHIEADGVLRLDRRVRGAAIYIWHNSPGIHTDYNIRFARQPRPGQFEQPTAAELMVSYIASVKDTLPPPVVLPPAPPPPTIRETVTAKDGWNSNIRKAPDTLSAANIVTTLAQGAKVSIGTLKDGWYEAWFYGCKVGFIRADRVVL